MPASIACGALLLWRRIAARPLNFRRTRCLSRRCAILWGFTLIHRKKLWFCVWTRNLKFKHWIARNRFCPCVPVRQNAALMITDAMAPPLCLPLWTLRLARSSVSFIAAIQRWLLKRPRFHLHFTPTSASSINLVERWFGLLTAQQLRRGVFRSTRSLETTIRNYIDVHNEKPKPFIWTKTADEILESVARFCQRTLETRH